MYSRGKVLYGLMAVLLVLGSLLAGCNNSGSSNTSGEKFELAKDQVLHFNLLDEPNTIDPSYDEDTTEETVIKQTFVGLVRYKPDLTVEPAIAESWKISADAKQFTFKLRDTKWSDGTPVTANDFEYAFKRFLDPKIASSYAFFLYDVKGAEAYNTALGTSDKPLNPSDADLAKLRDAVGVKALDAKTLQVDLAVPAVYMLNIFAQGDLSPLKKDVIDKYGDKWTEPANIVSNGPFKLKSWEHKSKMVLERNPNYFDKAPTLERIEFSFITEDAPAWAAYENNELDISHTIPDAQIPQLRTDPKYSKEVIEGTQLATYYVSMNTNKPPFDKKEVRQAFQMAVDTKTLCEKVLNGTCRAAKSFVPPGMPGYQADIGFDYNPTKAKELLAKAGYPDGKGFPEVTLVYNTSTGHQLRMEYVQSQLKQNLGINIKLENWESKTYFRKVDTDKPQMARMGWMSDYPHPNDWLRIVWASDAGQNYLKWKNTQFDDLVTKAAAEVDQKKAIDLYNQAQKILVDEAPAIWIYYYGTFRLVKPWVKGLVTTPQDPNIGAYFWKDIQIAAH